MKLAANLGRIRIEKGLTQSALAERLGVSDRAVSRWERGTACPDVTLLPRRNGLTSSAKRSTA